MMMFEGGNGFFLWRLRHYPTLYPANDIVSFPVVWVANINAALLEIGMVMLQITKYRKYL
jgi:hypothetical protein